MLVIGIDDKKRCFGGELNNQLYTDYHDNEWGIPVHNERNLFEMLVLEGAQAGLSWQTVLKKRAAYRKFFHDFDPTKVALMGDNELKILLNNPEIIRNRLKIYSARQNAQIFMKIQREFGSFDLYLWKFVGNKPIKNHWEQFKNSPTSTVESHALSKDLKKRGMAFIGPTIIYAYMQAVGMVNDHIVECWCYVS